MVYILILAAAAMRLMPHPDNVTPIMALGLFGGCYLKHKSALLIPLLALLVSDMIIGLYAFPIMASVYLSIAFGGLIGRWLGKRKTILSIAGGTLVSSALFFVVTNFALWAFGNFYAPTVSGLTQCYVNAIPFFRNSLLGNFVYVALLFGTYELAGRRIDGWVRSHLIAVRQR